MRSRIAILVAFATLLGSSVNVAVFGLLHPDLGFAEVMRGFGVGGAVTVAAALGAFAAARRLTEPLVRLRDAAVAIAGGDLTRKVELDATPEIADLAASFAAMTEGLQATIGELRSAAMTLDERSSDILGSVTRQAAMTSQQAAAINETSTTASEIAQTSKQATQHADAVIEMTKRSDDSRRTASGRWTRPSGRARASASR